MDSTAPPFGHWRESSGADTHHVFAVPSLPAPCPNPAGGCSNLLSKYHDMGLIGSVLGTLYCGGSGYYLSPLDFVRSPPTWITAVDRFRATHLQAPNFGFALTARKWKALKTKVGAVDRQARAGWRCGCGCARCCAVLLSADREMRGTGRRARCCCCWRRRRQGCSMRGLAVAVRSMFFF